ncbi:tripartite tricarboxylate transporter substrate binding protein [Belnapia sp. T6]|uniref:Tripartite tricarboxylate transporter substrate binding protein n=1 Tax=Belnapia mucosa TaxID=2804532 RepID=A0ABS1V6G3_9PROT|nr:tripartite tricarboxylate transporter substrate binding protein [Belnapia mucosa]MBL6457277.1 tripartite tricarboxylate transporter substrate binding protein [Belnapia mucosa]
MTRPMMLARRGLLGSVLAAPALAQPGWPDRPVRLVVPFAQGGPMDAIARLLGDHLQRAFGQPFVPEFRSGAGGNLGAQQVAQAAPDGYTLLVTIDTVMTVNPTLYPRAGYDAVRDFTPLGLVARMLSVVTVPPALPVTDIAGLVALGRQRPLTYGSAGIGVPAHLYGEHLRMLTGAQLEHVPYRGLGPAVTELLAGRIDLVVALMPGVAQHVAAGRLKALAVTGGARSAFMPEVPTLAETIAPGFDTGTWFACYGPRDLPPAIAAGLVRELAAFSASPAMRDRLAPLTFEPASAGPEELRALQARDAASWARVIREARISVE